MLPVLAFALAAADVAADAPADPCEAGSGTRTFVTCFDPGRGLELLGGASALGLSAGADLGVGIRVRGDRDSRSKAGTTWLLAHRAAIAELHLSPTMRHVTLTAYEGLARRHVDDGFLLLPTNPPLKLPFPLDVGLFASAARYERRVEEGTGWTLEVARLAMLFDPLRSASGRFHLGVGPAVAYAMRHDGAMLHHELTPLTAVQVFVSAESDDGRWVLRLGGWAGWTFDPASITAGGTLRARGELTLERVLIAVNDQPIYLQLNGHGALRAAGSLEQSQWGAGAALKLQLFSAQ